jgi:hypothetical protein
MAVRKTKDIPDPLMLSVARALSSVMKDPKASTSEKLKAIEIGVKLLAVRHKIKEPDDDGGGGMNFGQR